MIIWSTLSLAVMGFLFGIFLAIAAKKFAVFQNPKQEAIRNLLAGIHCGACGYPSCDAYAEVLMKNESELNRCVALSGENAQKLAEILGTEKEKLVKEKQIALVLCQGGIGRTKERYIYSGVKDCKAATLFGKSRLACDYGCIGFGTCERVCPFNAIKLGKDNLPLVDENKCVGCGICVQNCPANVIALVPISSKLHVLCNSTDKGAIVRKICSVGCIGCGLCVKVCPVNAITLTENLAKIDYSKCTQCGLCIEKCPSKSIAWRSSEKTKRIAVTKNGEKS